MPEENGNPMASDGFRPAVVIQFDPKQGYRFSIDTSNMPLDALLGQLDLVHGIVLDQLKMKIAEIMSKQASSGLVLPGVMRPKPKF